MAAFERKRDLVAQTTSFEELGRRPEGLRTALEATSDPDELTKVKQL